MEKIYYLWDKDELLGAYTNAKQAADEAMQQDMKLRDDVFISDGESDPEHPEKPRRIAELKMERVEIENKTFAYGDRYREQKTLDILTPEFREELGEDADQFDKKAAREKAAIQAQEREFEESAELAAAFESVSQVKDLAGDAAKEPRYDASVVRENIADEVRRLQLNNLQSSLDKINSRFNLNGQKNTHEERESIEAKPGNAFQAWMANEKQQQQERVEHEPARLETTLQQQQGQEHDFSQGC